MNQDADLLVVQSMVAYTHHDDLLLYIRCQEVAHGRRFSCAEIERYAYEVLSHRLAEIAPEVLARALADPQWCVGRDVFRGEDEEGRFMPCPAHSHMR